MRGVTRLCRTSGALRRIHFIDALYARSPTAPRELLPLGVLWFFGGRSRGFSLFTSTPGSFSWEPRVKGRCLKKGFHTSLQNERALHFLA
jgi:hypothetical protein